MAGFPAGLRPVQVDDTATSIAVMGRAALQVRVEDKRARFGAYALYRRAAEAATVRAAATRLLTAGGAEARVVVLGDLNDEPAAATTQILSGPPGSEIGTGGFDHPDQGDRQRLWNLAARVPEPQRFTRVFRGRPELIDHILVSHALVGLVPDGAVTTTGAEATDAEVPSITDDPGPPPRRARLGPPAGGRRGRPVGRPRRRARCVEIVNAVCLVDRDIPVV